MPNMAPRGLGGTTLTGDASGPAKQVWGCLPTETTYRKGAFVYGWNPDVGVTNGLPGSWLVLWADEARAPASASATVMANNGYVHVWIAWVESVPKVADTYRIRRPDGSVVADVPHTQLAVTDTDPRPGTGAYTVSSILAGGEGGAVTTNAVTLGTAPTWIAYPAYQGGNTVSWVDRSSGDGSGMRWYKNGAIWSTQARTPSTQFAEADYGAAIGAIESYRVVTMVNGWEGGSTDTRSVTLPPGPPRIQYLRPLGNGTHLDFLVYGPSGVWTYLEVHASYWAGDEMYPGPPPYGGDWRWIANVWPSTPPVQNEQNWNHLSNQYLDTRQVETGPEYGGYKPISCMLIAVRTHSVAGITDWVYTNKVCSWWATEYG
jgi:hypothetical protein